MTQTPASGPLAPVTTPPRSLSPIRTASAVVGCAPSGVVAEAKTTATAIVAAELQPRFVIICASPFSLCSPRPDLPHLISRRRGSIGGGLHRVFGVADVLGPSRALTLLARLRHRQVGEQAVGGCTMPVHRIGRDHHRVAGINRLWPRALADADAADAGEAIQCLAHRMGMPAGSRAWGERNDRRPHARGQLSDQHLVLEYFAGEIGGRSALCGPRRCPYNRHGFLRLVKIRTENRSETDGVANGATASIVARRRQHRRVSDLDQIGPAEAIEMGAQARARGAEM